MPILGVVIGQNVALNMIKETGGLAGFAILLFGWFIGALGGILAGTLVATIVTARKFGVRKCWQWLIWSK